MIAFLLAGDLLIFTNPRTTRAADYLLPGVKITRVRPIFRHRLFGHSWDEPVYIARWGGGNTYRVCRRRDGAQISTGPGKWEDLELWKPAGGSSAAVEGWKPVPSPDQIEPR